MISHTGDFSFLPDYLKDFLNFLLEKDDISLTDFKNVSEFFKSNKSQVRDTFISLDNFEYRLDEEKLILSFSLPKSSYATMVIRELERNNL